MSFNKNMWVEAEIYTTGLQKPFSGNYHWTGSLRNKWEVKEALLPVEGWGVAGPPSKPLFGLEVGLRGVGIVLQRRKLHLFPRANK